MSSTEHLSDWNRRLTAQVERVVKAAEHMPTPKTAIEVHRHARALEGVQRLVNLVCGVARPRAPKAEPSVAEPAADGAAPDLPEDRAARIEALAAALEAELPPMNRQQRRMAERMAKKRR